MFSRSPKQPQPAAESRGIAAVSVVIPPLDLPNEWFEGLPRKFVKHTGFVRRHISFKNEAELAIEAVEKLIAENDCQPDRCAGMIFTSASFVPPEMDAGGAATKSPQEECAQQVARHFSIAPDRVLVDNSYCSGYAAAMSRVGDLPLQRDEYLVVVTSNCISRITDYSCPQSSALFGDSATATLVARTDNDRHPVHLELLEAAVKQRPTNGAFFDFQVRENSLMATAAAGKSWEPSRVVFSMNGMGIADAAPRAMEQEVLEALERFEWRPEDVDFIVPHQAGAAIVRFTESKLRDSGFTCDVASNLTNEIGNISSSSIPYALLHLWGQLQGNVVCPVAAVGPPGESSMTQGRIVLKCPARSLPGPE